MKLHKYAALSGAMHYDVIIFERDNRHFTNVRKLKMVTYDRHMNKLKGCMGKKCLTTH